MTRKARMDMIAETRSKLIGAARQAFGAYGYANTSMDELTASVGLTRGALYHHFGDKKGLLAAVVEEIDLEMDDRLDKISKSAVNLWEGFTSCCHAYIQMALEPEIQRILLRDAPSVLGAGYVQAYELSCVKSIAHMLQLLMDDGIIISTDSEALARLINGGLMSTVFWLANSEDVQSSLEAALNSLSVLLNGMIVAQA
ncbi:TetR/AcrR family transcriptional regulator [Paenibacillus sp. GCM10012307]|uniref:TetR/AcrR family transcriptional regulator n=1 Tax=Paenibacillus roseus TaxID=2798579 RepID=A0A934J2Q4_9BACL|nr:TetR/AcrR family transcriptional regulator [Paenibacillus roseus]MBJ6359766.1 TetR/AcrR family transcriptional regulator [Paenibacillus roseus]